MRKITVYQIKKECKNESDFLSKENLKKHGQSLSGINVETTDFNHVLFLWAMILPEKKDFKRFDEKFIMAYYNTISKTLHETKDLARKETEESLNKILESREYYHSDKIHICQVCRYYKEKKCSYQSFECFMKKEIDKRIKSTETSISKMISETYRIDYDMGVKNKNVPDFNVSLDIRSLIKIK